MFYHYLELCTRILFRLNVLLKLFLINLLVLQKVLMLMKFRLCQQVKGTFDTETFKRRKYILKSIANWRNAQISHLFSSSNIWWLVKAVRDFLFFFATRSRLLSSILSEISWTIIGLASISQVISAAWVRVHVYQKSITWLKLQTGQCEQSWL